MKIRLLSSSVHIFVLTGFALAQPVFDLLSKHPEFLVARRMDGLDISLLVLSLCLLVPLLIIFGEAAVYLFARKKHFGVHGIIVGILIMLIFLPVVKKIEALPGIAVFAVAGIIGVIGGMSYLRLSPARTFLTVLSPTILIFPLLFVFGSPVQRLISNQQSTLSHAQNGSHSAATADPLPPIIMIVFDEFTSISLLDDTERIDPIRYPNFAALAQDAYWFPNATTVSDNTPYALPAILTGLYPSRDKLATIRDYPNNLFTLLSESYDLTVIEPVTHLCPENLCGSPESEDDHGELLKAVISDLGIVYLHFLLPEELTTTLPDITQSWRDFGENEVDSENLSALRNRALLAIKKDRAKEFDQFVGSINAESKPTLYFLHSLLPHGPYNYLPSGKLYGVGSGLDGLEEGKWLSDQYITNMARQRYLLQLEFVDSLIGKLVNKLKRVELYERSLLIITADHGVSFLPNEFRRPLSTANIQDIISVPLFIKLPHQSTGVISDRDVELIDIVPTIAELLRIDLPQVVDGSSVLDPSVKRQNDKFVFYRQATKTQTISPDDLQARQQTALKNKLSVFGPGTKPYGLFKWGPHNELIGRRASDYPTIQGEEMTTELDQSALFNKNSADDIFVPSHITGSLQWKQGSLPPHEVALAVNGTVWAVTKLFDYQTNSARLSAIVPEDVFTVGQNDVEVLAIHDDSKGALQLVKTQTLNRGTYSINTTDDPGDISIVTQNGTSIPVTPEAIDGRLDAISIQRTNLKVVGWAADLQRSELAKLILIFANGNVLYSGAPNQANRPDLVSIYNDRALQRAGFSYDFPVAPLGDINDSDIRVFAISKQHTASELSTTKH
ncbi:MAG: sulfatase-like hydrolase/transferase [Gammaproteobacteria bacterium]|nr:sulfatase-like hydrolase/transferase [Gammaproteobacteria bacterium]